MMKNPANQKQWANFALIATAGLCLSWTASTQAQLPATITTTDGQTYNGVSLIRTEPDGYLVNYEPVKDGMGVAKIKFYRLSAEQQKQAGYDPAKASEFESKVAKANEDWRQQDIRLKETSKAEIMVRQANEARDEELTTERISALAELKQAENAGVQTSGSEQGYGYWGNDGIFAIPQAGRNHSEKIKPAFSFSHPFSTEQLPAPSIPVQRGRVR
jgi:hypothetical protein